MFQSLLNYFLFLFELLNCLTLCSITMLFLHILISVIIQKLTHCYSLFCWYLILILLNNWFFHKYFWCFSFLADFLKTILFYDNLFLAPSSSFFFLLLQAWHLCVFLHFPRFIQKISFKKLFSIFFKSLYFYNKTFWSNLITVGTFCNVNLWSSAYFTV